MLRVINSRISNITHPNTVNHNGCAKGGTGDYLFVRRMDDQVKIDGFRIELAEIETVFTSCGKVERSVAVVRNGKLALYVKHAEGEQARFDKKDIQQMMAEAGRSLTHYMMPK